MGGDRIYRQKHDGSAAPYIAVSAGVSFSVEARESSQPRVEAWGSSQPRVVAWGYVQLSLVGAVIAKCAAKVAVLIQGAAKVTGGKKTVVKLKTAADWCDYYGVKVQNGVAILYKGVNADYTSPHHTSYAPGTKPVATDWDGGKRECGGGLHFSPTPAMTLEFHDGAVKFLACPVKLSDMRPPKDGDDYPQKMKAKGCCRPVYEVDRDGEIVAASAPDKAA